MLSECGDGVGGGSPPVIHYKLFCFVYLENKVVVLSIDGDPVYQVPVCGLVPFSDEYIHSHTHMYTHTHTLVEYRGTRSGKRCYLHWELPMTQARMPQLGCH